MGATRDNFVKYPRTPHLFGSRGTADDRHWGRRESEAFIRDPSLIIEEKLDGTNVGIHFTTAGQMVLQCRGHEITEGMHPQYDLFKQWASVKRPALEDMLGSSHILYGEWMYAKHSIHYRSLTHYFFEFDVWDKDRACFLTLADRMALLSDRGLQTVPVLHRGPVTPDELNNLIGPSCFNSHFDNPLTGRPDPLMEGLYLRTESADQVTGRAKVVRPEFVEKVKQSEHWQQQAMIPNLAPPSLSSPASRAPARTLGSPNTDPPFPSSRSTPSARTSTSRPPTNKAQSSRKHANDAGNTCAPAATSPSTPPTSPARRANAGSTCSTTTAPASRSSISSPPSR